jgi:hypothetical protein
MMKSTTTKLACTLLAVAALALAACTNLAEPAAKAVAEVESAISAASEDAGKYVPDQLAAAQGKLTELKDAIAKKDYKAVMAAAPAALTMAKEMATAAGAKKDEMMTMATSDWTAMSASLPGLISAVQSRVDVLGKSKHLPAGVNLDAAKTALADATGMWTQAQAAATSGDVIGAASTAKMVKEKAEAAAAAIGLKLPGA